jgi:bacillithiol system protein YtxJ
MTMQRLTTETEADEFLSQPGLALIFKHSTRCNISHEALSEVQAFSAKAPAARIGLILVVEDRPVSNSLTSRLDLPHQSPQAILIAEGAPVWSASHWEITSDSLAKAWSHQGSSPPSDRGAANGPKSSGIG